MIRSYFTIAFRQLLRHRSYTLPNILGLALGVAACLLLYRVVRYETSFDTFHPDKERIFRVVQEQKYADGNIEYTPGNPLPAARALKLDLPQLERITSVRGTLDPQVTVLGTNPANGRTDKKFLEANQGLLVEPAFFDLFPFPWLIGSPQVLKNPDVAVLTRKQAEKYFGDWQKAVGQYLKINNNNKGIVRVGGVLADLPENTDFPADLLISYESFRSKTDVYGFGFSNFENWGGSSSNDQIFVRLAEGESVDKINAQLKRFSRKHFGKDKRMISTLYLSPLRDQHFTELENFSDHRVKPEILRTLSLIGVLIIVMACINFVNLATAQAVSRAKEVGVRKVLGSHRTQLVRQFMTETLLIVCVSVVLGVLLAQLALPLLVHLSQVPSTVPFLGEPRVWLFLLILTVSISFLAGFYPALVLSGFQPVQALKAKITGRRAKGLSLRRGLVVTQFAIAQMLIIGTLVAVSQMDFIGKLDLGFQKEGVYVVVMDGETKTRWESFKNTLLQNPAVQSVSFAADVPSSDNTWTTNFAFDNSGEDKDFHAFLKIADAHYFKTYGLQFAAGEGYRDGDTSRSFVINETMLRRLGLKNPADAVGKTIKLGGGQWRQITGVVADFKTASARESVPPLVITPATDYYSQAGIKIQSKNLSRTVGEIQQVFEKTFPEVAFNAEFFEDSINNFYQQEQQLSLSYQIFAGLAILISCLGLYGLVALMAVQKTKEIGIRKVLGAGIGSVLWLFGKEFGRLILIAFVVAAPVAWYVMNNWLQDFAYRTQIGAGIFVLSIAFTFVVAVLTVGYRSVKAALANPVKSLRSE